MKRDYIKPWNILYNLKKNWWLKINRLKRGKKEEQKL